MKKILLAILLGLFITTTSYAANLLSLTEDTAPTSDDMMYCVDDVSGGGNHMTLTRGSRTTSDEISSWNALNGFKVKAEYIIASIAALAIYFVAGEISGHNGAIDAHETTILAEIELIDKRVTSLEEQAKQDRKATNTKLDAIITAVGAIIPEENLE